VKRSFVFYWLLGIMIAAVAIAAAFHFDTAVSAFMAQHRNRVVYNFMYNVSRFGDWPEHLAVGLILAVVAWRRGNRKWTRIFLSMLIALAIAGIVGRGIQIATGRARPSVRTEEVWNRFSSKYNAFPSGHVTASMAFFGVLFFANRRVAVACLAIPILIGFSRIYIEAHYLSDVVCGIILGILSAALVARVFLWQSTIDNRKSETRSRKG
jgi:undecaprenyl-diphosphatase